MSDPLIARFADACGATGPLDLRVDLAGGCLLAEGSVAQPFTLVGRDDSCDVTLSDPEINPRHAWLQVLGGRVFVVDLGSRTGLKWPTGDCGSGWLDVGTPTKIGPFLLQLNTAVSKQPSSFPLDYNPLVADTGAKTRPTVALEFRNGKRAKDRWSVNRLITLVGRAPECKIHLNADDISLYHCGLVSTRTGLWVVDLSGRGVVVNGERMRVAPLPHAAELWVGRFLIGCQYQPPSGAGGPPSGGGRTPVPAPTDRAANGLSSTKNPRVPPLVVGPRRAEDEVELGAETDAAGDLPNSHILADPFRPWGGPNASGPPSNAISVSGSGPAPGAVPVPPDAPLAGLLGALGIGPTDEGPLTPFFRQMADLHARMSNEFEQWLALMVQMFGCVRREHLLVVQHELNRIEDLTAEIAVLQAEVSRQAIEAIAADRKKQTAPAQEGVKTAQMGPDWEQPHAESWIPPSAPTPVPDTPALLRTADTTTPLPVRGRDRLHALQQERAARWQAVIALFTGG